MAEAKRAAALRSQHVVEEGAKAALFERARPEGLERLHSHGGFRFEVLRQDVAMEDLVAT